MVSYDFKLLKESLNIFMGFLLVIFLFFTSAQKIDLKSSSVIQKGVFLSVSTGEAVTLECSYEGLDLTWIFWYKQTLGQRPEPISSFYTYASVLTFFDPFNNSQRFTLDTKNQNHHLRISDLQLSDSATYYCVARHATIVTFTEGVTVRVKGPGVTTKTSIKKINACTSTGTQTYFTAESKDAENLHYAALNVKKTKKSRRQENDLNTVCVYVIVRQQEVS
uniref:Ig-like domain-containing protein n=1 Tax=Oryzias latipes TaxID=8090 RepID=A0A3P9KWG1_ORYLA